MNTTIGNAIAIPHCRTPPGVVAPRPRRPPLPAGRTVLADIYAPGARDETLFHGPIWQVCDAKGAAVYACSHCHVQAPHVHDLYRHFVEAHLGQTFLYRCPVCTAATPSSSAFWSHGLTCGRFACSCRECGHPCVNALELYAHQWKAHVGCHVYRVVS